MKRKKEWNTKYSPEFKISVIMDMREHHLGYRETVRKYWSIECLNCSGRTKEKQKAEIVTQLRQKYPLEILLKISKIKRSTYYYNEKKYKEIVWITEQWKTFSDG